MTSKEKQQRITEAIKTPESRERLAKNLACRIRIAKVEPSRNDLATKWLTDERELHRSQIAMVSTLVIISLFAMFFATLGSIRAENIAKSSDATIKHLMTKQEELQQRLNSLENGDFACWPSK